MFSPCAPNAPLKRKSDAEVTPRPSEGMYRNGKVTGPLEREAPIPFPFPAEPRIDTAPAPLKGRGKKARPSRTE